MVERNNIHWNEKHTLGKVQVIFKVLTLIQLQAFWLAVFHALPFIIMQCNAFVAGHLLQGSHWLGSKGYTEPRNTVREGYYEGYFSEHTRNIFVSPADPCSAYRVSTINSPTSQ